MAYGIVKVDNITFDNGGSDQNVTVSGLYRATTSGVTVSGTIAAGTVSGVTVIGSTTVSGDTVTGTTANFTSGNFSNIISSAATMSGALIMANQQQVRFREAVGNGVNHIALQAPAIVSADQTITLPDQTGTVITTGDNGSVSSTMLATNLTISAAAGSATTPSIAFTGDLNTGIYSPGADQLAVSTGGTGRLFVDASGSVGIGTASPSTLFHCAGTARIGADNTSSAELEIGAGATGNRSALIDLIGDTTYTDYGLRIVRENSGANTNSAIQHRGTGALSIAVVDAGVISLATNNTERARIDSNGRLLVGTTSAVSVNGVTAGFELHALATTNGASASIARFNNDNVGPQLNLGKSRSGTLSPGTAVQDDDVLGEISFCGDDGTDLNSRAVRIACEIDGTPGANDMPGRLVFATTADGASSPTERMRITSGGVVVINGTAPVSNEKFFISNAVSGFERTSDGQVIRLYNSSVQVGNISVTASATAYNTSSDYRLKENITPLDGAITRLNQLPVHRFNFIADPDTVVDGFIAHEAEAVVPECVTGEKDEVDEDGDPVYQGIDQSKIVPLLTAALQEAIAKIDALEARIAALEA